MKGLIRVVVVDDHLVTRQGIISLIQKNEHVKVVAEGQRATMFWNCWQNISLTS